MGKTVSKEHVMYSRLLIDSVKMRADNMQTDIIPEGIEARACRSLLIVCSPTFFTLHPR